MRVLVTGAAGFVGSHVTRQIVQEGHEVTAVILPGESTQRLADITNRLSVIPLDLREGGAVSELVGTTRPECAMHMAWYAAPGKYWTAPENLDCVSMTLTLAQVLAGAGCARLVGAGSCAEYDWGYGFLSENITPLKPHTLYGSCKNAARQMLEAYCAQTGMNFAWTRLFYLYGPGEAPERLVPSVATALLDGKTARCGSGRQIRDFLHIRDVASAIWAVARSAVTGPVNVGSGEPVSVRTIVDTIARQVGGTGSIQWDALAPDSEEPPLLVADTRKLTREVGWQRSISLDDGLRDAIDWWRQRGRAIAQSAGVQITDPL
ncbi:MAG: NAD(P)-dependent oxidoreductase [Acidobacteria bacterium]|nr:NAD(P)-dependent oxidoreductase [Acidobacteriota bacterium]